jgi:tetratricopeptide (TPR) repeat protein
MTQSAHYSQRLIRLVFSAALFAPLLMTKGARGQEPPASPTPPPAATTPAATPNVDEFGKAVYFGQKFFELNDYASAYQKFAAADSIQPDQPGVLYNMALLLARTGRYSEAQVRIDRYLQLYPAGAERALANKLQLELEFQRELQKKRQTDQEYDELFTRGTFLYARNDLDAALKLFEEAEQRRPSDSVAVFDEGTVLEKMGDLPKAAERFRRYLAMETEADLKSGVDQHVLGVENEIQEMKTRIVCAFCGFRLPLGATWCPHCWHGPYLTSSAVWNSRPCLEGASATRATFFSNDRFNKNDILPCLWNGTMLEALRYTAAKQKAIQETRKSEGWTYNGDVIEGWRDKDGSEVRYEQGPGYLEKIVSGPGGEILSYNAHKAGDIWLLDREDVFIEGQKYTSHYTFDANNRIAQQQVDYQNAAGCNHAISMTADYSYQNDDLTGVKVRGGYDGFVVEGMPHVEWQVVVTNTFDTVGRLTKEDLTLSSFSKTYTAKPYGAERGEIDALYPTMRVRRPIEDLARRGDRCATSGSLYLGNPIDLRPFYAASPDLAIALDYGVTRATVRMSYPDSFKPR